MFIAFGVVTLVFHKQISKATEETYKRMGWFDALHKGIPPFTNLHVMWIFVGIVCLYIGVSSLWTLLK